MAKYVVFEKGTEFEAAKLKGGATNRVIAHKGGSFVDFDIDEALAMTKGIDEYQFLVSRLMVMY